MATEELTDEERRALKTSMNTHMLKAATELMGANEIANLLGLDEHDRYTGAAIYAIQHLLDAGEIDNGLSGGEGK